MKVKVTKEDLLRPLGDHITDPEALRFFSRVGPVSFHGRGDEPIDYAALNRELDECDRRFLEDIEKLGEEPTP
jgi:hypothetical protein